MLTREEILGKDDLPKREVDVPEWGGKVFVRTMTGAERDKFETVITKFSAALKGKGDYSDLNIRAKLVSLTLCDEHGKRLFSDADVVELSGKSAAALDRLSEIAQELNKMSDKDIEDLEKKLRKRPSRRFAFRLALQLGMTVRELLGRIGADELAEWMAFYKLEPFGRAVDDFGFGIMAAVTANQNLKKGAKAMSPLDFVPQWDKVQVKQSNKSKIASLTMFAKVQNKRNK